MKQYSVVLKLLLKNMFRRGADKKKSGYILAAYISLGVFYLLIAALLVLMTYGMTGTFGQMDLVNELITMLLGLGCLTVLLFGLISMLSVVYFSKDTEFFLALPVKPSVVYICKLSVVYLSELAVAAMILVPCLITAGVVAHLSALYYFVMVFAVLTVPVIPLLLASIVAIPLMYVVSFFKNKGALTSIVLILLCTLFFGGYYFIIMNATSGLDEIVADGYWEQVAESMGQAFRAIANGLYPLYALARFSTATPFAGLGAGVSMFLNALIYLATIAALLGLTVLVSNTDYKRGAASQLENARTHKKTDVSYAASGVMKTLIKKEWRELIRTPAFAFQSLSGILLCPIVMLFMGLSFRVGGGTLTVAGETVPLDQAAAAGLVNSFMMLGFICMLGIGMNVAASTCISREGQTFVFCKMIPVSPETQMRAKSYLYLIISAVTILTGYIIMAVMNFDWTFLLPALGFLALYDYGYVHFAMLFDLYKPKLVWATPNEAVKNNRSAVVPMLINMGVSFVIMIVPMVLVLALPAVWIGTLVSWLMLYGIGIAVAVVFPKILYNNAARLYAQLTA